MLVGLGNPGKKYQNNRHNVGYQFIEYIVKLLNGYIISKKNNITIYQYNNFILAKPNTFMNLSGLAIKKLTSHYSLATSHLIIVHDDLDIPLGKFHIQKGVGPKLHNGLDSIEQNLKSKDFWRIRIGVDKRTSDKWTDGIKYVLQDFLMEERINLEKEIFPKIFQQLQVFLKTEYSIVL